MQINPTSSLFWSLLIVLTFSACQNDGIPETNFVIDIEDEFNLGLIEQLSSDGERSLTMEISSLREYNCKNYTLSSNSNIFGGERIQVSVDELVSPVQCLPGDAPAIGLVDLGVLGTGDYQLSILIANQIENKGSISIHSDYYEVQLAQENGILLPYARLNRVPTQIIWGYVGYENDNATNANQLLADMQDVLEIQNTPLNKGNYGHFFIQDNGQLALPKEEITDAVHQTFLFELKGSIEELQNLVEQTYCPQYQDLVNLKIYSSEGAIIECL